ncbi:MAG: ABC transporter permease [Alphaproteobacteria bacterium]
MYFTQYFQFLIKELNKNKSKISKVFFTIFISLLIFSSVTILKNSVEDEIEDNSRVFLGGDVELSTKNVALNDKFLDELKDRFLMTEVIEFTSIIRTKNDESKTTRIKVIDNFYPLLGNVKVEPANSLSLLKSKPESILIDKSTKNNLGLKIGEKIKIQNISFEIIGIIESLPDIGGFFLFGDQALINKSGYNNLKINNLGSFLNFKYKIIKRESNSKLPQIINENKKIEIKYPEDISQNLKKTIENFIYFLSIIAASAILISGIGLKNSLYSFLSNNQFNIAVYKSLGLSSNNIKTLYYAQTLIILVFCSLISYTLGLLIILFLDSSLLNFLNIELNIKFKITEYLIIQFFSIVIFFIFAKPVVDSIDQIKIANLFRNSSTHLKLNYTTKSVIEIGILLTIFVSFFCILNVKPQETAVFFFFFIIISFFYYFLSKFYIFILSKTKNAQNLLIKMGIKNLKAYRSLNSMMIVTMGLGMTTLFFLGILSSNINKELDTSIPQNAPHYFFLGIQENELKLFKKQIREIDYKAKQVVVPMISARIEAINNKNPKELISENNKSFWFVNGERRISWSKTPPFNNPIIEGEWWEKDEKNKLQLSLDYKVASDLKLKIGDSITFNIFGNSVSGVITNFRKVDYRDLNINFAILFNPKYASKIPHEYMSTVKFDNEELVNLSNLLRKLPTITYIKLSEYINKTKDFLENLLIVSLLISTVVILIGLIVISNAISVIGNLKVHQNLVFRILGFEKEKVLKLIIFESFILFIPIIVSSLIFSIIFSYFFIINFFGVGWHFPFLVIFIISSLFLLVFLMTLLLSNRKYLNFNTYHLLRNG